MSLHIYSGGFTRFFAGEWESGTQKRAREADIVDQVDPPCADPSSAKWEEVEQGVQVWKKAIKEGLGAYAPADLDWNEGRDAPYFTDQPGWEAYSALVLLAASTACQKPLPERLPTEALSSEVVARAQSPDFDGSYRAIVQVPLWLPGTFEFSFDFVDLRDQKAHIGSVQRLLHDLNELMKLKAISEGKLAAALRAGYDEAANFKTVACYGLAALRRMAQQALKNRLPMMLTFDRHAAAIA